MTKRAKAVKRDCVCDGKVVCLTHHGDALMKAWRAQQGALNECDCVEAHEPHCQKAPL